MSALLTPFRVEAAFWALLCGGLATGIAAETDWGRLAEPQIPRASIAAANFTKPELVEPPQPAPVDSFMEMPMRPLFISTRRPAPPAPPPDQAKPTMNKDQFTLTGITVMPEGKFAFMIEKAGNKNRVVGEGKEINGLTVKEISAQHVVLTQNGDSETLTLKTAKGPAATIPVTPPQQAAMAVQANAAPPLVAPPGSPAAALTPPAGDPAQVQRPRPPRPAASATAGPR